MNRHALRLVWMRLYVGVMLWVIGRALVATSRVDETVRAELAPLKPIPAAPALAETEQGAPLPGADPDEQGDEQRPAGLRQEKEAGQDERQQHQCGDDAGLKHRRHLPAARWSGRNGARVSGRRRWRGRIRCDRTPATASG